MHRSSIYNEIKAKPKHFHKHKSYLLKAESTVRVLLYRITDTPDGAVPSEILQITKPCPRRLNVTNRNRPE